MKLLSVQTQGMLYLVLIFLICIVIVHCGKLIYIGYRALGKKMPPPKPKKKTEKSEPVYFIVERKKKRAKAEYDEPRRIQFK